MKSQICLTKRFISNGLFWKFCSWHIVCVFYGCLNTYHSSEVINRRHNTSKRMKITEIYGASLAIDYPYRHNSHARQPLATISVRTFLRLIDKLIDSDMYITHPTVYFCHCQFRINVIRSCIRLWHNAIKNVWKTLRVWP